MLPVSSHKNASYIPYTTTLVTLLSFFSYNTSFYHIFIMKIVKLSYRIIITLRRHIITFLVIVFNAIIMRKNYYY